MISSNIENSMNPLTFLLPTHSGRETHGNALSQNYHSDDRLITQNAQATSEALIHYTELSARNGMMNDHHKQEIFDGCSRLGLVGKKPVKKERHSKICTAQGLRDRRVRLSIGIAREFFDLQDMLGFDKASQTLEWLLKKSRKAIQELQRSKNDETKSFVLASSTENLQEVVSDIKKTDTEASRYKENKKSKIFDDNEMLHFLAKEPMAKAREKTCNKQTGDSKTCPQAAQSQASNHLMRSISRCGEAEKSSSNIYGHNMMSPFYKQTTGDPNRLSRQEVFEKPVFPKKKLSASTSPGFNQPNLCDGINSNLSSCSNTGSSNCVSNFPQNWDINYNKNNPFTDSAFCAMTGINLSEGFQIYGKPW